MGKALLIVNPDSGRRDGAVFAQCVLPLLEEAFDQVECRMSRSAYDVESWACEACASVEALFVMGGDGTVGLGLRGLFEGRRRYGRMPTFNPLPAGAGNGFVRTLGLPSDPAQVVAALDFSKTKALDATFVNGVSFAHTVTGGTLPEGIREVSSDVKTRFGLSAYAVSELPRVGNTAYASWPTGRKSSKTSARSSRFPRTRWPTNSRRARRRVSTTVCCT